MVGRRPRLGRMGRTRRLLRLAPAPQWSNRACIPEGPEGKATKDRIHLDLRPDDQDAEVMRFESLGARRIDVGQKGHTEVTWVVLADPKGNAVLPPAP